MNYRPIAIPAVLIMLLPVCGAEPAKTIEERRREFFHEKITPGKTKEKRLIEILSANIATLQGYVYESGFGTRQVNCVEVRFKINTTGEMRLTHLSVYVFDSKKKPLQQLNRVFLKMVTGSTKIDPDQYAFKGKKTYTAQFDYPSELIFKYFVAVAGTEAALAVETGPRNADWQDFEFPERQRLMRQTRRGAT